LKKRKSVTIEDSPGTGCPLSFFSATGFDEVKAAIEGSGKEKGTSRNCARLFVDRGTFTKHTTGESRRPDGVSWVTSR